MSVPWAHLLGEKGEDKGGNRRMKKVFISEREEGGAYSPPRANTTSHPRISFSGWEIDQITPQTILDSQCNDLMRQPSNLSHYPLLATHINYYSN